MNSGSAPDETRGASGFRLEASFPRDISALEALFALAREFFQASGLADEDPFEVELILEELFTNQVKYNPAGQSPIQVALCRRSDAVEIRLRDFDAEPFDVTRAPAVDLSTGIATSRPGGLGLHLVRCMSASLTYDYTDRVSTITATKRLGR